MFTKQDLLGSFATVDEVGDGYFFFQHRLPKVTYQYCLKSLSDKDLLIVSEDVVDFNFSMAVIEQIPQFISLIKPSVHELSENIYGFSHVLVVPSNYHSSLKGDLEPKRGNLLLCVPIFRCEFSGEESESEFKEMISRMVPVFKWNREVHPKLKVYFDNPSTGAGTYENGALFKFPTLMSEVENLSGVVNGFIEITNYNGKVLEVLSPANDIYTLIRNRTAEEILSLPKLQDELSKFSKS